MSDVNPSQQLINALLDNQLDAEQADKASKQIAADPELSAILADFTRQRENIGELPKYQLGEKFGDRVIEIATLGSDDADRLPPIQRPSTIDWKRYAMSLAAIAALLMGMLVFQWTPGNQDDGTNVARLDTESEVAKPATTQALKDKTGSADAMPAMEGIADKNSALPAPSPIAQLPIADEADGAPGSSFDVDKEEGKALSLPNKMDQQGPANMKMVMKSLDDSPALESSSTYRDSNTLDGPFGGTPAMAMPVKKQVSPAPPTIDQVWLLEADKSFTQDQLLLALSENSIDLPEELRQSIAGEEGDMDSEEESDMGSDAELEEESELVGDDGGIYVAASAEQMKNALATLSRSGTVTISAYQLPDIRGESFKELNRSAKFSATNSTNAPSTIIEPRRAVAQRLRGNRFAPAEPLPSSMVPETFEEVEKRMERMRRLAASKKSPAGEANADSTNRQSDDDTAADEVAEASQGAGMAAGADAPAKEQELDEFSEDDRDFNDGDFDDGAKEQRSEMKKLFPKKNLDSQELKNFLILIRPAPAKR